MSILAMHIPDGFLSIPVSMVGWLLAVILVAVALRQMRHELSERQVPLMGVLAAFVFAAQMINFPVAGGTSGHLLGGALVAILLGPWAAVLVMTSVVSIQALLFQDGGLLAMGFNIFNMGIVSAFVGYMVYSFIRKASGGSSVGKFAGAGIGAWLGVEAAAVAVSLQLALSNTSPLEIALPAMLGVHALIGAGEALITIGALAFIQQARPELLREPAAVARQGANWVAVGLVIALLIACFSPLANPNPDGLERVAEDQGFLDVAQPATYEIFPDYTVSMIQDSALTTVAAGVIGVLLVAGVSYGTARLSKRKTGQGGQQI
ncbi:MAG: PDGLE domain-containing protein [Anaerolineae bacterium]|nr:PDGLE domain-containing protein [Anaerolineae bacterium]